MRRGPGKVDLLLLSMPFGPLRHPSIGLSLLQAALPGEITATTRYFSLDFAERITPRPYNELANGSPTGICLAGEWVFGPALFESDPSDDEAYVETVLRPHLNDRHSADLLQKTLEARAAAAEFIDWCADEVETYDPKIVGFTSVFQQQVASLALARRLQQRRPGTPILFGGANCESTMGSELVRRFPQVDLVVSGEADSIFAKLVRRLLDGRPTDDIPGVYTARNLENGIAGEPASPPRVEVLDELPRPDIVDFYEQWNATSMSRVVKPRMLFETSRGCWWGERHHCTFCGLNGSGMAFRSKSPERAIDELEELVRRYPDTPVMIVDNILDMQYFKNFVPELARRKLGVKLFYEVKANLRKDQIRALGEAGISEIQPGIETLSDEVLQLMRKGVSGLQNLQLLKWCAELGVWPTWHFIWGFPNEPAEAYRQMAEQIPLLTHLPPPNVAMGIRLDRFSPNFFQSEEMGFTDVTPLPAYRYIYPELPAEALRDLAYYFTFGYRDDRDVDDYTRLLAERIREWKAAYESSECFYLDKGEELWIMDLRPVALRPLTVLDGLEKVLYLACDGVRTLTSLARFAGKGNGAPVSNDEVEARLDSLVEAGLILRQDDRMLALAVRGGFERTQQLAADSVFDAQIARPGEPGGGPS